MEKHRHWIYCNSPRRGGEIVKCACICVCVCACMCVCELGRGCFDRSLVPSAVREMRRSGHVGCCSVSHNLEFGFTLRTVGNHGKSLSKGVKWLDLQWLKQNKTKHSVYCGKNGLAGSQNGRRENKLEALPSPQRLYGVMVIVVCDLFLFLVPP